MTNDALTGIGELIDNINNTKTNLPEVSKLLYEAADKLDVLFDYIVDTETKSAIRISNLEQQIERLTREEYTWCDLYD